MQSIERIAGLTSPSSLHSSHFPQKLNHLRSNGTKLSRFYQIKRASPLFSQSTRIQPRKSVGTVRASTEGTETDQAGPWFVKNDFPDDYVLLSNDPDELEQEVKNLEKQNELLRKKIDLIDLQMENASEISSDSSKLALKIEEVIASESLPVLSKSKGGLSSNDLENSSLARSEIEEDKKKTDNPISVVFVASEVAPYSKTGGLADVTGSLPLALASRGHRVMVVAPRYMNGVTDELYASAFDVQCRIKVFCFHGEHEVAFFHEYRDGVDFVFVDHPSYHRPGNPYGDTRGTFGDNQFRFTLLCHAACEAPLVLPLGGFTYGQKCLFVANDWHAGLVPVILAAKYRPFGVYTDARCILAIHNLLHQGVEPGVTYGNLGLPAEWYGALEWVFPEWQRAHALDKGEAVNILKGAIVTSDRILTVSQGYAWEITTPEGGWGLEDLLRGRSTVLNGITNGVDVDNWNPQSDVHIPSQYTADDLSGKAECKAELQKEFGFEVNPDIPLIGFIGRLDHQKGPDLIQESLEDILNANVQMVMLGSGEPDIEAWMQWAESTHKKRFSGWVGFSVPVAHRITAGCDILLMPSRFEPCGLNQLYAMRYGTVPVAHCTGGLRDTIETFNPFANGGAGAGTGWTFSPLTKEAMLATIFTAVDTYKNHKESWKGLMLRGMTQDMSWERAALQYEQVFEWAMMDPPYA